METLRLLAKTASAASMEILTRKQYDDWQKMRVLHTWKDYDDWQ